MNLKKLLAAAAVILITATAAAEKPNVVIFYLDDYDFDDVAEGYDLAQYPSKPLATGGEFQIVVSPNIDELARSSLIFDYFHITSPVCTPSRYSLLTGQYASTAYNLDNNFEPGQTVHLITWNTIIKGGQYNMAKMFKSAGYATGVFGKLHCEEGLEKLREVQRKYQDEKELSPEAWAEISSEHKKLTDHIEELYSWDIADRIYPDNAGSNYRPKQLKVFNVDWVTEGALNFIEENKNEPFFLYFPVNLPHSGPGNRGGAAHRLSDHSRRATSAGMLDKAPGVLPDVSILHEQIKNAGGNIETSDGLTLIDAMVGLLTQKLRETNNFDNTVFVFLSDHQAFAKNTPHAGPRVPCMIRWPDKIKKQRRSGALCANIDLLPTLAEIAGAEIPEDVKVNGKSFMPLLMGDRKFKGHESIMIEINYARALLNGDYKYIEYFAPDALCDLIAAKATYKDINGPYKGFKQDYDNETRICWYKSRYGADKYFKNYFDRTQLYNTAKDPLDEINLVNNRKYKAVAEEMRKELTSEIEVLKKQQLLEKL